jgi:hypothetical protein
MRFGSYATSILSGKTTKDVPEVGIPMLASTGNAADNYSAWSDKFTDFMSNYRSCYTGAPLTYLLRDDDAHKIADSTTYETLDMFLVESVEFNPAINPAFIDENKVLAAVLSRALGSGNSYAAEPDDAPWKRTRSRCLG